MLLQKILFIKIYVKNVCFCWNDLDGPMFLNVAKDHAEHLTIQGLNYIFNDKQKIFGKAFWYLTIGLMTILGIFWSMQVFILKSFSIKVYNKCYVSISTNIQNKNYNKAINYVLNQTYFH